ncbi:holliday junction resolvase / crossover junction endodeoxyribonuclease [Xanthomonas phage XPP8]|nr:holliday junction resolvase / crossover junction endodeoxyribonuclease [Xanthomonas phage XPP8]
MPISARGKMTDLRLTLPWPPTLNSIWRAVHGRIVLSAAARDYKRAVAKLLPVGKAAAPLTGRLMVWVTLFPPSTMGARKWDVANREKIMIDCLTDQRIWLDDSQIDALVLLRGEADGVGRAEVTIQTITDDNRL